MDELKLNRLLMSKWLRIISNSDYTVCVDCVGKNPKYASLMDGRELYEFCSYHDNKSCAVRQLSAIAQFIRKKEDKNGTHNEDN